MVYSDRNYHQEAIANLNSTSPLTFRTEDISAEDLARDLDIFTNTQFFDFDFGVPSTSFTSLDSPKETSMNGESNSTNLNSISTNPSVSHFQFLQGGTNLPIQTLLTMTDPLPFDMN